jgi:hypothetical protein
VGNVTDLPPERREELAEALSVAAFDFTAYSETAHPDHNRWSWRGAGHGEQRRQECYEAVAALAPLLARWRREDMAEGAAEVKARVETAMGSFRVRIGRTTTWLDVADLRAALDTPALMAEMYEDLRPKLENRAAIDTPDPETTP